MFVTVLTYRAKPGEEDAIIGLHEDWQRRQQSRTKGFLSGELLKNAKDARTFVTIMRFENQAIAQVIVNHPDRDRWHQRLASLTEEGLTRINYTVEWQTVAP
jgi:antibiotic biosynthesis monooxygenase (ABM) superfamily enzyme